MVAGAKASSLDQSAPHSEAAASSSAGQVASHDATFAVDDQQATGSIGQHMHHPCCTITLDCLCLVLCSGGW